MPDLRITRDHQLGFEQARQLAKVWADSAAEKLDMSCDYEEGDGEDRDRGVARIVRRNREGEDQTDDDAGQETDFAEAEYGADAVGPVRISGNGSLAFCSCSRMPSR